MSYYQLTRDHIQLARKLRETVDVRGYGSCVFEPGNGTRIAVAMSLVSPMDFGGDLMVSLPDFHKCWAVQLGGYFDPTYVNEKFGLRASDASAFTEFLNTFGTRAAVKVL